MRRGWCPSLAAPMETGDGWLVRFVAPLSGAQAAVVAEASARLGNGRIDVTGRGSFQIRGLTPETAVAFSAVVAELGLALAEGPVSVGALAGLDAAEAEDPRPMAAAIRAALAGRALGPKASIVVDGGGALPLDGVAADVRVRALGAGVWEVAGRRYAAADVVGAVLAAVGSGRDRRREVAPPIGRFPLRDGAATGLGVPFGQMETAALSGLAAAVGTGEIRPAAGRALMVIGAEVGEVAARLGFITEADDPRLAIVACSGAPACASGRFATRVVAAELAGRAEILEGVRVHLSGCPKRCAEPAGACVSLVGGEGIAATGVAVPARLRAFLEGVM